MEILHKWHISTMASGSKTVPGQRFGPFVVLGRAPNSTLKSHSGNVQWYVRCDCGEVETRVAARVIKGQKGCHKCLSRAKTSHGEAGAWGKSSVEYRTWSRMKSRCYLKCMREYPDYGGRGIVVCERWRSSFPAFLEDMGRRPGPGYQIDRINNDGNYEPGNCRWVTAKENGRNKRNNRFITFAGETLCVAAWAERLGITSKAVRYRIENGWTLEEALTCGK